MTGKQEQDLADALQGMLAEYPVELPGGKGHFLLGEGGNNITGAVMTVDAGNTA